MMPPVPPVPPTHLPQFHPPALPPMSSRNGEGSMRPHAPAILHAPPDELRRESISAASVHESKKASEAALRPLDVRIQLPIGAIPGNGGPPNNQRASPFIMEGGRLPWASRHREARKLCRYFLQGHCTYGAKCRYERCTSHGQRS
jgi:hypothetical protein